MIRIARGQQQQAIAAHRPVAVGQRTRDTGPFRIGKVQRARVDQGKVVPRSVAFDEGELHGPHLGCHAVQRYWFGRSAGYCARTISITGPPIAVTSAWSASMIGAKLGRACIAAT